MKTRLQLWPLWAVALGLWHPLDFMAAIDGYSYFVRPLRMPFVYAASFAIHVVPMLVITGALAIGGWLVLRTPRLVAAGQFMVMVLARGTLGVALFYALIDWLTAILPTTARQVPHSLPIVILIMLALAVLITWRSPQPGRFLALCRRVWIVSAIAVAILLPLEALLNAIQTRHAPHGAQLKAGDKPDVVLITVDTLAANHMSLYGYERETTPRLSALAQEATVFDHFYANSNFTSPTSASFLYGVRSWAHRAWNVGSPPVDGVYGHNLLQAFHDAGYEVMTVDTNPCAAPAQNRLMPWVDHARSLQTRTAFMWTYLPDRWLPSFDAAFVSRPARRLEWLSDKVMLKLGWFKQNDHFAPEESFEDARQMWTANAAKPRFLWVHLFGPHDPYAAPPPYLGMFDPSPHHRTRFDSSPPYQWATVRDPQFPQSLMGRYDEGVRYFDDAVGGFVDWLKQQGSFDGAIIAISADHGESFSHKYGGHGGPLLTQELIHIPLILKTPGQKQAGHNATVSEQVDLPQTLLHLAGLPLLPDAEGRAVLPDAAPDDDPVFAMNFERNPRFAQLTTGTVAMVQGSWKYVHYHNLLHYQSMPQVRDELFDVNQDPGETTNLIDQQPERAQKMKAAILAELDLHDDPVK